MQNAKEKEKEKKICFALIFRAKFLNLQNVEKIARFITIKIKKS
jgi:hypothetical protein